jgi:hypothetical protein
MSLPTLPPLSWLSVAPAELGRWSWEHRLRWPAPLDSSRVGRWEPQLEELLAGLQPRPGSRPRGEERLLADLAEILAAPDYSAFAIRATADGETHYAALTRGPEAVVVVDAPGEVRLARIDETMLAVTVAAQLPRLLAAPTVRTEVPGGTAALLASGLERGADRETLDKAMASAGIPPAIAGRLLAGPEAVAATGMLGAARYDDGTPTMSPRSASWTEMADGAMLAIPGRAGDVVWEPFTAAAAARCLTDALGAVRS